MHSHASTSSDGAFSEKVEPNLLIDYSSDSEKAIWAAEANLIDGAKCDANEIDRLAALKKLRGSKVQTSSASVSDNWGSLQVHIAFTRFSIASIMSERFDLFSVNKYSGCVTDQVHCSIQTPWDSEQLIK